MTAVIPGAFTLSQPCALQDEPTDCFLGDPPAAAVAEAFELSAAQQGIGRILPDPQRLTYLLYRQDIWMPTPRAVTCGTALSVKKSSSLRF